MRKSLLVLLGAFVLCGAVLVGCNNKVEPVKPEPSPTPTPVVQTKQVFPFGAKLKIQSTCIENNGSYLVPDDDIDIRVALCDKDGNELTEYSNVTWTLEFGMISGEYWLEPEKGYFTEVWYYSGRVSNDEFRIICTDEENNQISCLMQLE